MRIHLAVIVACSVLLPGCGKMHANRLSARNANPDGVLVQVPAEHGVFAVLPESKDNVAFRLATVTMPSRQEVYDIDFRGGMFASSKLMLDVHPSGTVKKLRFERVDTGSQSLSNSAGAISAAAAKQRELEAEEEDPGNPVDAENAELQRQLLNLMLQANIEAAQNGRELPFPGVGT